MPERVHAQNLEFQRFAYRAFRRAMIWHPFKIPERCEGCAKKRKLVAHHDDYLAPMKVVWWCRRCHAKFHWSTLEQ